MARNDSEYYSAIALLAQGTPPMQVAKELAISPSTVIRWNTEYVRAKDEGTLDKLLKVDELVLHEAARIMDIPVNAEAKAIAKSSAAKLLEDTTIATATNVVTRINTMVAGVSGADELCQLVKALCDVQTAFFNKQTTQVNVQNNLGVQTNPGAGTYSSFLGDAPGE